LRAAHLTGVIVARVFNFSAGPAVLPEPVLRQAAAEMLDWHGSGMSVMEMSHRGKEFTAIAHQAEADLRELMRIPAHYKVLFLHGGATLQFAMVPVNLLRGKKSADYIYTGEWSKKAIAEAKKFCTVNVAASSEDAKFTYAPTQDQWRLDPNAAYVHYTPNETIGGVEFHWIPDTGKVSLVADMSSDIASRPIDISKFGLIFAGAQKNLGPSGVTLGIVRKDLAERADRNLPTVLQYRTHIKEKSLYHTPPTFAVYILGLVTEWMASEGGLPGIQKRNEAKAKLLYDTIDNSNGFYSCPVEKSSRSLMNVVFRIASGDEAVEKDFGKGATAANLVGTPGHRSVGGMRISLYNAVGQDAVEALVAYMREFQRTRG
jgi:phosphoserine aminotransferase